MSISWSRYQDDDDRRCRQFSSTLPTTQSCHRRFSRLSETPLSRIQTWFLLSRCGVQMCFMVTGIELSIFATWFWSVLFAIACCPEIWWPSWLLWGRLLLLQPPHLARQNGNSSLMLFLPSLSSLVLQIDKLYKLPEFLGDPLVSRSCWNLRMLWLKMREL